MFSIPQERASQLEGHAPSWPESKENPDATERVPPRLPATAWRIVPILAEKEDTLTVVVGTSRTLRMPAHPSRESPANGECSKCLCTVAASFAPERLACKRGGMGGL